MGIVYACIGVFLILLTSELLWRKRIMRDESARKFVHILVGTFVAFWPWFMSWREIQFMSLAFIVVVAISWRANIFKAVHGVERKTWGELFFPLGIGMAALLEPPNIVFAAAILHLALADGLAAIVGKKYGLLHQYRIGNYTKTFMGTLTFWVVSMVIIGTTLYFGNATFHWPIVPIMIWLPLMATLVENVAVMGLDNIFVPLLVIFILNTLSF